MKDKLLKFAVTFAIAGLVLISTSRILKKTDFAGFVPTSLFTRNSFYFGKGQWLADTRTAIAAVQYLYRSRSAEPINASNSASNSSWRIRNLSNSTNLIGLEEIGTAILSQQRRLSRADSMIIRTRLSHTYDLAAADPETSNNVVRPDENMRRPPPQSTNMSNPAIGRFSSIGAVSGA